MVARYFRYLSLSNSSLMPFRCCQRFPASGLCWFAFSHDDLLSKNSAPAQKKTHPAQGNSPQIDVVFGLRIECLSPLGFQHGKSLAVMGLFASYLRRLPCIVHASVWRPAFGAPAWRRPGNTWRGWRKNRPACHRWRSTFPGLSRITSASSSWSAGSTAFRNQLHSSE